MFRVSFRLALIACSGMALMFAAMSCGGGGGASWFPNCSTNFATPNYTTVVDQSTGLTNKQRWWKAFPIKVWFDLPVTFDNGQTVFSSTDIITTAFNRWPAATSNGVKYTFVANQSEAHVKIFIDILGSEPGTLAVTTATVDQLTREVVAGEILFHAWIGMSEAQFVNGLKATAGHEMGHVLYISGHSNSTGDLMYWSSNSSLDKAISSIDLNTILTAYCGDFQTRGRGLDDGAIGDGPFVIEKTSCPVVVD